MSRPEPALKSDPHDVATTLDEIVDMLNESWKDLTRLLTYKDEFEMLAEQLQHYEGSVYVQQWYVADLLMGCRRLVEHSKDDVLSVRRALYRLRAIADQVTAADIAACRERQGQHRSSATEVENDMHHMLGPRTTGDPIGRRAVQHDLDGIGDVADRVHHLATHSVAHRLKTPLDESARSVTRGAIAALLDNLHSICQRWSLLLRNIDLSRPPPASLSPAILKALELFNFEKYVEAVDEEVRRLGPTAGWYEDVEARARIEYRFDADE